MKPIRNLEKKDKRSKRSDTLLNKARLRSAKKNLKKQTSKYGTVSEAAEKGAKAVRKVTSAQDRVKRVSALAGRDPQDTTPKAARTKAKAPAVKTKKANPPKVKFAGGASSRKGGTQFNDARMKGRLKASKKAGCYGRKCD